MNTIEPNTWYTLHQLFGDSLLKLDEIPTDGASPKSKIETPIETMFEALFKGSTFLLNIERIDIDVYRLEQTRSEEPIYYPLGRPNLGDVDGVPRGEPFQLITRRYGLVGFNIDPSLEEDLENEQYRYSLLLRSEKGTYVSEGFIVREEESSLVGFYTWRPGNSDKQGDIFVPLDSQKIGKLEIMLMERQIPK